MDQMDQNVGRKMATVSYVLVEWLNKSRSPKGGEKRGKGQKGPKGHKQFTYCVYGMLDAPFVSKLRNIRRAYE